MKTKTHLLSPRFGRFSSMLALAFSLAAAAQAGQGPQPSICTRACWVARNGTCTTTMSDLTRAIIHHTAGTGDYTTDYEAGKAKVRTVQNYHMDGQGWCDIAYHFLVTAGGHIYEGRKNSMTGLPKGSHDCANGNSFGFNVMGYYHPPYNQTFTGASRSGLEAVIAWRMPSSWSPYGSGSYCQAGGTCGTACNTVGTLDGHYKVKSTACPGDGIIPSIPAIRDGVNARKNPPPPSQRIDVFVRGTDNALHTRPYDNNQWYPWARIGGTLTSDPSAVSWGMNRIDVFFRGTDNGLYMVSWTGTQWVWGPKLADNLAGAPDAASWGLGRIDVFWRGTDNALHHRAYDNNQWHPENNHGGILTSDPSAVSWGANRIDIYMRNALNQLQPFSWTGTQWVWGPILASNLGGGVDACSWGVNRIDLFWRSTDNTLRHRAYEGTQWYGESNLGGILTSDPGATTWGAGRLDCYTRGTDGTCAVVSWTGTQWVWSNIGGGIIGGPDACSWSRW